MRKLGKYEVLGELGHGAMGVVYRARDPIINRLVALKTITTGLADDPSLLQRFYREAQSAGGLQHPNIVTIYDMGDEQKLPYIAMELIEGESLDHVIQQKTSMPVTTKLAYALQACRAFDYAHKRGIVHRDIKPGNVMVTREGVVKVVDFGIARVLDASKTQTGMLIGTFAYMSPEQYNGEHADERSDIWSFGVLLYELLCYHRPFTGETPARLMHSICSQDFRPICERGTDCPPEIEAIVSKMLRKSAQERFQSMEDLLMELEPVYKEMQARCVSALVDQGRELIEKNEYAQARETLREALKIDSGNTHGRALLEKANVEIRRLTIRPKAEQHVNRGRALLEEGRIQEAQTEAENALNLESTFGPAQELEKDVRRELDRAQMVAEWLQASGQRLAEGSPEEAEELLARVLELDPSNRQAQEFAQQVLVEKTERRRRLRLLEGMQEARGLWSNLDYDGCIGILSNLHEEFPGEDEIQRLLDTVREDQAEQRRQKSLADARNLLAAGNYGESRSLLLEMQKQFPSDEEIPRLLEDVRVDEAKRRRLQGLAEARNLLSNRRYDESIARLAALEKDFPGDREIALALATAIEDQAEQLRQQGIADVRNLLAARRYDECESALSTLQDLFPNDKEIRELQKAIREEQVEERKQAGLAKARNLLSAGQYRQAIELLTQLGKDFAAEEEIPRLLKTARAEQAEQEKQQGIGAVRNLLAAQRYGECGELLSKLNKQFPNDLDISQLQKALEGDQAEQRKSQGLAKARNLLSGRNYEQGITVLKELAAEFPKDEAIPKLLAVGREGLTEQRKLKSLEESRTLLAARRYDESISLLTRLKKEFPDEREVSRLLANASKEQAEQQKQQKLAEGRTLLAAQKFTEALELLDSLGTAYAKDPAVQKLRAAVERESEKQKRSERLQGELETLKKLISEKKYSEILVRAEPLRSEFPANADLLRLIDFARTQQTHIDSERRLRVVIEEVKGHGLANRFAEAIRAADAGLKAFPGNAEISYLREQAEAQEKRQKTRGMIEQRIREIKFKINREDLSEAIDLAKQTIAAVGPDSDLTQLLNSAVVEFEARERKRRQEQKLHEIRRLMESGDTIAAADTLNDAVATQTLDSFDPRVTRVTQEIKAAKNPPADVSATSAPSLPGTFSKEYALLQGRPLDFEPPTLEKSGTNETSVPQAFATQPTISQQPAVPLPPPLAVVPVLPQPVVPVPIPPPRAVVPALLQPVAPVPIPPPLAVVPALAQPVVPVPLPPPQAVAAPPMVAAPIDVPQSETSPVPGVLPGLRTPGASRPAREHKSEAGIPIAPVPPQSRIKKVPILVVTGVALGLGVWATLHFVSSPPSQKPDIRPVPTDKTTSTSPASPAVTPKPPVNPSEDKQRSAIAASDRFIASGDFNDAMKALQGAEKLNGPLTGEIKDKEASISESMHNEALAKLRQEEAALWQQSLKEVDKREFEFAKRDLRKIVALGDGGVRRTDAQKYLNDVIPKRQNEEDLFRQGVQSSRASDPQTLQHAAALLDQVTALDGSRKTEAEGVRRSIDDKIAALKQEATKRQVANLESTGRADLQQGDIVGARMQADQIRQVGGDPSALWQEIERAQAGQIQQQKQFQQAVQTYNGTSKGDKSALEKSRGDFQAIANANGPHVADAQQYLADINKKLDALSAPPVTPAVTPRNEALGATAADDAAIRTVVQRFFQAFEQRSPDGLSQVWPNIPPKKYADYKRSFEKASSIRMQVLSLSVKTNANDSTASAQVAQEYTPNGQKGIKRVVSFSFQLSKANGSWTITGIQ